MPGSILVTSGGKTVAYETEDTWPSVTKVFNMSAFGYPETRFSTDSQAAHQRSQAYPKLGVNFKTRGTPQLTFFDAAYDVYAHDKSGAGTPTPCKYPQIVTAMKAGVRKCLDPTAMTDAERAELAAEKAKNEAAFAAGVAEQMQRQSVPKYECSAWYQTPWTTSKAKPAYAPADAVLVTGSNGMYAWKHQGLRGRDGEKVYNVTVAGGGFDVYSCATGKKLYHTDPNVVRGIDGLGATEGEAVVEEAVAKQKKLFRTTEYALMGLFAAGLFLIWRK